MPFLLFLFLSPPPGCYQSEVDYHSKIRLVRPRSDGDKNLEFGLRMPYLFRIFFKLAVMSVIKSFQLITQIKNKENLEICAF